MTLFIFLSVCFLAYANGANDNFKGVASLFGGGTTTYRTAISWATLTTFAGSVAALFLAETLVGRFSGKGIVPDALTVSPPFLLAVALGAGATVILATALGFPVSTTHGLTGALVGAGTAAVGRDTNFAAVGQAFVLPLLVSPLLAVATGACVSGAFRRGRLWFGDPRNACLCAGMERPHALSLAGGESAAFARPPALTVTVDHPTTCTSRYGGRMLDLDANRLLDALHLLSAGAVSFARGLNDTPKIAALLLAVRALDLRWGLTAVASAMAVGGLLNARKVAATMSHRITAMRPGQGLAANLSTAALVTTASLHGLPVSTTHVSVGALLGMGIVTRQTRWRPVLGVLAAWVVTLPCSALLGALAYRATR